MKRIITLLSMFLILALSSQATHTQNGQPPFGDNTNNVGVNMVNLDNYSIKGDLNDDGVVNVEDVTTLIDYLLKGTWPEDPHMNGYWLVMIFADGTKEYIPLQLGANGDYLTAYDVMPPLFDEIGAFYYMINGEAYGAPEYMFEAGLGDPAYNPLIPGTNPYYVYVDYSYSIGVHIILDAEFDVQGYQAYVARGGICQP